MAPAKPLPYSDDFMSADEYVESILRFSAASIIFQTLCGGVHILDFFTSEPSLYHTVIPQEWRTFLASCDSMELLDLLMRDDVSQKREENVPESLIEYIKEIRKHSLQRTMRQSLPNDIAVPRHVAVGMIPKKIHEVSKFAAYVDSVASDVSSHSGDGITHFVDFGSGQNYLGRCLASPPYNKHIVAVESKEGNIKGAKSMDVFAGVAEREKVRRNKKVWRNLEDSAVPEGELGEKSRKRMAKGRGRGRDEVCGEEFDLRPSRDLKTIYTPEEGKGFVQYVEHVVQDGDLSSVVEQIQVSSILISQSNGHARQANSHEPAYQISPENGKARDSRDIRLMAISIHSCGNLSHHGIRSLLLNPSVHAIAIIGCCYNLMTERLGPSTYKLPILRRNINQRSINAPRIAGEADGYDPNGFPMSERLSRYSLTGSGHGNGEGAAVEVENGINLNISARMMAVQNPQNWTEKESEGFFTRHFFRALLQKVFLDYGVVARMSETRNQENISRASGGGTEPIIIGSLRKGCYVSFVSYVRGALEKINISPDSEQAAKVAEKMAGITDEQVEDYERRYGPLKKELSVTWSLMAFSAGVVESLIVTDRWLFLKEHEGVVRDAWVEAVFDYKLSPRNLVVVGVKK